MGVEKRWKEIMNKVEIDSVPKQQQIVSMAVELETKTEMTTDRL